MTYALKGAVLSGLVYPGLGQLVLKSYKRGAVFITAASAGVAIILWYAIQKASEMLAQLDPTGAIPDANQILSLVNQRGTPWETSLYHLALLLLAGAWVFSTLDAYLIGRNLDLADLDDSGHMP